MSMLTRRMVDILQVDKRQLRITDRVIDELEGAFDHISEFVIIASRDEVREKWQYTIEYVDENEGVQHILFEAHKRAEAFAKLVIRTPRLYEPVREIYNALVYDKYVSPQIRRQERKEARMRAKYEHKMKLIEMLKDTYPDMGRLFINTDRTKPLDLS